MGQARKMTEPCAECGLTGRQYATKGLCNPCYRRLRRQTDPAFAERMRESSRRWKTENAEQNHARARQRYHETKDACPSCGTLKSARSDRCDECHRTRASEKRELIERLWAEGKSCAEIGALCGFSTDFQSGAYREAGWDLPYRYQGTKRQRVAA